MWRQIESFAGYSFSKAHSASYAVESYQSLYLKAYFPLEFMVGVINNFGGFYPGWVYFNEARNWGAHIHLPCVNNGRYKTSIRGKEIYIGFIHINNLENLVGQAIEAARHAELPAPGSAADPSIHDEHPFTSLEDFVNRVPLALDQLVILIRTGAFRFTGKPKATMLWEAHLLLGKNHTDPAALIHPQSSLFPVATRRYELPDLWQGKLEDAYDEIEFLGWPVTLSWFELLETSFRGEIMAEEMNRFTGKKVRMLGLLVTIKYTRTIRHEWMHFGTFIDVNGRFFDTVHFPKTVNEYPFRGDGIYLIFGRIVEEFGFPSLEVEKMAKMPLKKNPRE